MLRTKTTLAALTCMLFGFLLPGIEGHLASATPVASPDAVETVHDQSPETTSAPTASADLPLSVLATRATTAARKVFKKPQLEEVRGRVDNEHEGTTWRFIFNDDPGLNHASVVIEITSTGAISPPEIHQEVWVGNHVLTMREISRMTPSAATDLLRSAGYDEEICLIVLRRPIGPEEGHPLYIFSESGGRVIAAVDTVTHHVTPM